jgi:hypothetical protein
MDPVHEKRIIAAARGALEQKADDASSSPYVRDDAEKSTDALDAYLEMRNQLAGYDYQPAPKSQRALNISGVEVSVYCDLLIHRTHKEEDQIGGLLFRLTVPEDDETERAAEKRREMGLYVATLVHMHVAEHLAGNRTPHYPLCWSVDVQNKQVYAAPKNVLARTTSLQNACRFIRALWDDA